MVERENMVEQAGGDEISLWDTRISPQGLLEQMQAVMDTLTRVQGSILYNVRRLYEAASILRKYTYRAGIGKTAEILETIYPKLAVLVMRETAWGGESGVSLDDAITSLDAAMEVQRDIIWGTGEDSDR